jgi:hypothetical protein
MTEEIDQQKEQEISGPNRRGVHSSIIGGGKAKDVRLQCDLETILEHACEDGAVFRSGNHQRWF